MRAIQQQVNGTGVASRIGANAGAAEANMAFGAVFANGLAPAAQTTDPIAANTAILAAVFTPTRAQPRVRVAGTMLLTASAAGILTLTIRLRTRATALTFTNATQATLPAEFNGAVFFATANGPIVISGAATTDVTVLTTKISFAAGLLDFNYAYDVTSTGASLVQGQNAAAMIEIGPCTTNADITATSAGVRVEQT